MPKDKLEDEGLADHGYLNGLIINARRRHDANLDRYGSELRRKLGQQAFEELTQIAAGESDIDLTADQLTAVQRAVKE